MNVGTMPESVVLAGWAEADGVCDALITATVDGGEVWLRCEVEGDHDEHEATLHWKTEPPVPADE